MTKKPIMFAFLLILAFTMTLAPASAGFFQDLFGGGGSMLVGKATQDTIIDSESYDPTNRISYWSGKVNQHNVDGTWYTDPDGKSGANIDMLTYCKKWWPDTIAVEDYGTETISGWKDAGNRNNYESTKPVYKCVQGIVENTDCNDDVKMCPDGSMVERNIDNDCEFEPCTVAKDYCIDSDDGKSIFEKGRIAGYIASSNGELENYTHEDKCLKMGEVFYVDEFFCDSTDRPSHEPTLCKYGCDDGACLKEPVTKCSETDNGRDYYMKGRTTQSDGFSRTDYCTDEPWGDHRANLIEYFCDENGNRVSYGHDCAYGCDDGACLKEPAEEEDVCCKVSPVLPNPEYKYTWMEEEQCSDCRINSLGDKECISGISKIVVDDKYCETKDLFTCYESDKGLNEFVKGKMYGRTQGSSPGIWKEFSVEDHCIPKTNTLVENFCDKDLEPKYQPQTKVITCEFGCDDGACKKETLLPGKKIAFWEGKVNQHYSQETGWKTDPDGVSGAGTYEERGEEGWFDRKLEYCQKFWPETTSVEQAEIETINTWRNRGNSGGPFTSHKMTYNCIVEEADLDTEEIVTFEYDEGDIDIVDIEADSGDDACREKTCVGVYIENDAGKDTLTKIPCSEEVTYKDWGMFEDYILGSERKYFLEEGDILDYENGIKIKLYRVGLSSVLVQVSQDDFENSQIKSVRLDTEEEFDEYKDLSVFLDSIFYIEGSDKNSANIFVSPGYIETEFYAKCMDQEPTDCYDSDGGKNPTEYGEAKAGNRGADDACSFLTNRKGDLREAVCVNGQATHVILKCPEETPYCYQGVCGTKIPKCTDSDRGIVPGTKGTIVEPRMESGPKHTDYCTHLTTNRPYPDCKGPDCGVREFFCTDPYITTTYKDIPCKNGCSNGACIGGDYKEDFELTISVEDDRSIDLINPETNKSYGDDAWTVLYETSETPLFIVDGIVAESILVIYPENSNEAHLWYGLEEEGYYLEGVHSFFINSSSGLVYIDVLDSYSQNYLYRISSIKLESTNEKLVLNAIVGNDYFGKEDYSEHIDLIYNDREVGEQDEDIYLKYPAMIKDPEHQFDSGNEFSMVFFDGYIFDLEDTEEYAEADSVVDYGSINSNSETQDGSSGEVAIDKYEEVESEDDNYEELAEEIDVDGEETLTPECSGCEFNGNCIPVGVRVDKQYCSTFGNLMSQKFESLTCENNFECQSNVCLDGECVNSGLIKRIIEFFKRWA